MLCEWRVRKKGRESNPYEYYRDFPNVFCLKINHGGTFTTPPKIRYKGGKVNWVDDIDSDIFSIVEVTSMMKELGYENPCMAYYYKKPNTYLDNGLTELAVDKDVCEMLIKNCKIPLCALKDQLHKKFKVGVSKQKVFRAKNIAYERVVATTIQKFDKRMKEMKHHNIEAYEWLRKIPPQHWARCYFSGREKSNILLNNMCEVLNRQLVDGRDKPIITCLEYIREYIIKRIVNVQKVQDKFDEPLTPNAAKIFKLIEKAAAKLKVDWNGSDLYQVTCPWGDQFVVNMSERVCSCRKWELSGIPCTHAKKSDVPTTIIPPKSHPQIGRPPKKRKKSAAELANEIMKSNKMTRSGKSVTCSLCKQVGHNQRGCKSKKSGDVGAGSQGSGDAGVGGSHTTYATQSSVGRVCKSQKSGHVGAGLQRGGDAGVGGSQATQTTQSSVGRAQHPSFLHASPTKMTKSSANTGGP
uniref:SWIM-type domain-containing protein n=1 Tax=Tanacetum cinerariifolium TaxID=118510 RepID=A0A699GT94_TANCI|nr:hypothetical protein [Tanacetum cinerariifolium]